MPFWLVCREGVARWKEIKGSSQHLVVLTVCKKGSCSDPSLSPPPDQPTTARSLTVHHLLASDTEHSGTALGECLQVNSDVGYNITCYHGAGHAPESKLVNLYLKPL